MPFSSTARSKLTMHTGISQRQWERAGTGLRAGVLLGLFNLRSRQSVGIGDLADLRTFIDWAHQCGLSIVQLLPMNETGGVFCPYDAVSSCALEPSYLSFSELPGGLEQAFAARIEQVRQRYPTETPFVDYGIRREKLQVLREMFGPSADTEISAFTAFCEQERYWLDEYALYKTLKAEFQEAAWYAWPDPYRERRQEALEAFSAEHSRDILFLKWVQWLLYEQLRAVKAHAAEQGVLLKGDLPILVSRDSHDVWAHPEFFKLSSCAGAPPDMYCARGQRWGMPTYDWEAIAADGYRYFKTKLAYAGNFYHLLRIDHVVGFFRIWSIPYDDDPLNQGLNGAFDPADESLWEEQGRRLLSVILDSTDMLVCAEDLGTIPPVCRTTLEEFGICGNDVQRWTKDWEKRHDFLSPEEYRSLAVAMLSTHDTTNWPAWWQYEAGTIDEALFMRKCAEKGIDYATVREKLFEPCLSTHGRLRWREEVDSADTLCALLGRDPEAVGDLIGMYRSTYLEKEKLWKMLGLSGPLREAADSRIVKAALGITLSSRSVFCIETLIDWMYAAASPAKDPYAMRINTPGTVNPKNWALRIPFSLEELSGHPVSAAIRELVAASPRKK